ncbi:MAG TPA: hypothetical protein VK504_32305, partial [Vicinamibacterales bacterium]|nr:hypothetical protein [Vicinamibacterales bacterium]
PPAGESFIGAGYGPGLSLRSANRTSDQVSIVEDGVTKRVLSVPGQDRERHYVAMSGDGRLVVSADQYDIGYPPVRVWDAQTGTQVRTLDGVGPVAISRDGARVYYTRGFGLMADPPFPSSPASSVTSMALVPGDELLAVGKTNGTIDLIRVSDGSVTRSLHDDSVGRKGPVTEMAISADGSILATGGDDDTSVRIWRTSDGSLLHSLAFRGGTRALAFTRDGSRLLIGNIGSTLTIADVSDGAVSAVHEVTASAIQVSPDDQIAYVGRLYQVARYRLADWTELSPLTGSVGALALSADGTLLASASGGTARIYCLP